VWNAGRMTSTSAPTGSALLAEELARDGLEWLLAQGRPAEPGGTATATATGNGNGNRNRNGGGKGIDDGGPLAWPLRPSEPETNPTLHQGTGGVVLALLEGRRHFAEDRYGEAALRAARSIASAVDTWDHDSLYFGLAGMAFVLRSVERQLGDDACGRAADRALTRVRGRFDGQRWNEMFELFAGNAGIGLAALACGDLDLALLAVTPYTRTADATAGGVNWPVRPSPPRSHHIAHGTLGIVFALAAVGHATDRADLIELALRGASDVVARNEAGPDGFLVPHSDPPHRPDIIERVSYGWCNGPAGDALVFRLLAEVTGDRTWSGYVDRCWHTVTESGLPRRIRPGFWDNNGRCCGTAGVLATACDRIVADDDDPSFAHVLVADLVARATVDEVGARWSNHEHRQTPSGLEPRTDWAHGNAGIVRELLRYARIGTGGDPAYAVGMPDHAQVARRG
jgi:hypothetical protein